MTITDKQVNAAQDAYRKHVAEHGVEGSTEAMRSAIEAADAAAWENTKNCLPKKPGKSDYEYVDCLIIRNGEMLMRPWNCEHHVFDDEEKDDFYCDPDQVSHWRPIPASPKGE